MYDAEYLIDNIKKSLILACMAVKSTSCYYMLKPTKYRILYFCDIRICNYFNL